MLPAEVFISHSDRDRQFVSDLVEILRRHGIPVWYSRTNLVGAQQWHDEIIPLLYQPCDYEEFTWTLSGYQMVDFTNTFEDGCRELLRVWGVGYKPNP